MCWLCWGMVRQEEQEDGLRQEDPQLEQLGGWGEVKVVLDCGALDAWLEVWGLPGMTPSFS